jgi:tRNA(Ile)-lysidine synthase TilS/MesJ
MQFFLYLIEWRVTRVALEQNLQQTPQRQGYKEIIAEHNAFRPSILKSMRENSEDLAQYLYSILRLQWSDDIEDHEDQQDIFDPAIYLTDQEILEYATQHDLPVTISVDGSHEMDGVTTATIRCMVLPLQV